MGQFDCFFEKATGFRPYPYQRTLAAEPIQSRLIHVPTGAGKTAAAILAWLWQRGENPDKTPRRLVYCLPMRVLVEQTRDKAKEWADKVAPGVGVYTLMGGEVDEGWELYPERPAILVGTQDMLLSRALNRGYAMSRYRWPVHFGLLNNDCLWVCDEIQLMGSGLATTAQLEGFRQPEYFGCFGPVATWWMSATMDRSWLETVDYRDIASQLPTLTLRAEDLLDQELADRYHAAKPLTQAEGAGEAELAQQVLQEHRSGSLTLAVLNTVERAQKLHQRLERLLAKRKRSAPELLLAHSRYRPAEREVIFQGIQAPVDATGPGRILVATQVVEAGVDISARTLFTELAPWASLVQRFGRCNRKGEFRGTDAARVFWIDPSEMQAAPYTAEEVSIARGRLRSLKDAAIPSLEPLGPPEQRTPGHVIRRKDLLELFDTTPDLSGAHLDVSRYIRDGEDLDVAVYWRAVGGARPSSEDPQPRPEELCPVPVYVFRKFIQAGRDGFRWDPLAKRWPRLTLGAIFPGQTYMMPADQGGYSPTAGWTGGPKQPVTVLPPAAGRPPEEAYDSDVCWARDWVSVAEHSDHVARETRASARAVGLEPRWQEALDLAARWHDRGKAHAVFQEALPEDADHPRGRWAKAPGKPHPYSRPRFRHELASALAVLGGAAVREDLRDLVAYLVAAHHGKVRLTIRSLPNEEPPPEPGARFARGIWEGDILPAVDLGGGVTASESRLSLELMQMGLSADGNASWAERMLRLRDAPDLGPLRLVWLEALVRICDWKASQREGIRNA